MAGQQVIVHGHPSFAGVSASTACIFRQRVPLVCSEVAHTKTKVAMIPRQPCRAANQKMVHGFGRGVLVFVPDAVVDGAKHNRDGPTASYRIRIIRFS